MPSLEAIQRQISAHITELPPDQQTHALQAVAMAFQAGYRSCQDDMRAASQALISKRVH